MDNLTPNQTKLRSNDLSLAEDLETLLEDPEFDIDALAEEDIEFILSLRKSLKCNPTLTPARRRRAEDLLEEIG